MYDFTESFLNGFAIDVMPVLENEKIMRKFGTCFLNTLSGNAQNRDANDEDIITALLDGIKVGTHSAEAGKKSSSRAHFRSNKRR
jgi:hypothetical protein